MKFIELKSPNYSKKKRNINQIIMIIIHYTGMQSMRASINRLMNSRHKVSCHYLISREGKIFQMVNDNRIAWHAGQSKWGKFNNLNDKSIGIELVNKGHKFGYQKFSKKQIKALIKVCSKLKRKYKIKSRYILGHSDVSPLRKSDPGEKFPWSKLNKKKIGIWYSSRNRNLKLKKLSVKDLKRAFLINLHKLGYRYFDKSKPSKTDKLVIKSFQRRFRQKKVNGVVDFECFEISDKLVKKH